MTAPRALASISTGLVQLHRRFYGKGPTRAKTHLVDDTVICLLRGGFTTVEQTLVREGDPVPVHRTRRSFQAVMEEPFRTIVEDATGRKVVAYMSQATRTPSSPWRSSCWSPIRRPNPRRARRR